MGRRSPALFLMRLTVDKFVRDFPARMNSCWRIVDHRVGVLDSHAVRARMSFDHVHDGCVGFSLGPVTLPFEHYLNPGDWFRPGLFYSPHGSLMGSLIQIAAQIFHDIYFVSVVDRLNRRECDADFSPKPASTIFLRPVFFTAATNFSSSHEFMLLRSIGV